MYATNCMCRRLHLNPNTNNLSTLRCRRTICLFNGFSMYADFIMPNPCGYLRRGVLVHPGSNNHSTLHFGSSVCYLFVRINMHTDYNVPSD